MNIHLVTVPVIAMTDEVARDISDIVAIADQEIGWLGHVTNPSKDFYLIDGIYIPDQEVDGSTTEISPKGQVECMTDTGWESFSYWGHSHHNMTPSPSGQDDHQFKDFYENSKFFIRHITNKRGEHSLALYDGERQLVITELEFTPIWHRKDYWTEIIAKKVSRKSYSYTGGYYSRGGHHNHKNHDYSNGKDFTVGKTLTDAKDLPLTSQSLLPKEMKEELQVDWSEFNYD